MSHYGVIGPMRSTVGGPRWLSPNVKAGLGLLVPANVDFLVAFSTAYWATWKNKETGENGGYGLWKIWHCVRNTGTLTLKGEFVCDEKYADTSFAGWYVTVQVLETLALAGMVTALIMLLLYILLPQWHRNKAAMSSIIGITYLSGLFMMVSLFVFGFKVAAEFEEKKLSDWTLSWSFSLACTAFVLNQLAASILVGENKRLDWRARDDKSLPTISGFSDDLQVMLTSPSNKCYTLGRPTL